MRVRIFITGCTGVNGSAIIKILIKEGNEMAVYDYLSFGIKAYLSPAVQFIEGDILDENE